MMFSKAEVMGLLCIAAKGVISRETGFIPVKADNIIFPHSSAAVPKRISRSFILPIICFNEEIKYPDIKTAIKNSVTSSISHINNGEEISAVFTALLSIFGREKV